MVCCKINYFYSTNIKYDVCYNTYNADTQSTTHAMFVKHTKTDFFIDNVNSHSEWYMLMYAT